MKGKRENEKTTTSNSTNSSTTRFNLGDTLDSRSDRESTNCINALVAIGYTFLALWLLIKWKL
jgi:hypothetical protein